MVVSESPTTERHASAKESKAREESGVEEATVTAICSGLHW